jgi:hypothetical protein
MQNLTITLGSVLTILFAGAVSADTVTPAAPASADCWVVLFDEPSLEGDQVRLQGPTNVPKLADLNYKNGENLNNDVRGVQSGRDARVTLFGDANFEGAIYRIFPDSSVSIDKKGFGEDASSLQVTCEDPNAVSAPPPGSCWVEFYDEPTLEGDKVRFEGAQAIQKLAEHDYANGDNLNDDIRGVRTGPAARVELFGDANFKGDVYRIYEGSSESIAKKGFGEEASSAKVTCLQ